MTQMPPTPPAPVEAPPIDGPKVSGLAIAALILGICSFVPLLGLLTGPVAIVLGIVALARKVSGKGLAIGGVATGLAGLVLVQAMMIAAITILLPALSHSRELPNRVSCQANLNAIGKAIALYKASNRDIYPPDVHYLVRAEFIGEKMLRCPSSDSGREMDYFYLPSTEEADGQTIVACDYRRNHKDGRGVLFAGLYVKYMSEKAFQVDLDLPINAEFAAALREAEGP